MLKKFFYLIVFAVSLVGGLHADGSGDTCEDKYQALEKKYNALKKRFKTKMSDIKRLTASRAADVLSRG